MLQVSHVLKKKKEGKSAFLAQTRQRRGTNKSGKKGSPDPRPGPAAKGKEGRSLLCQKRGKKGDNKSFYFNSIDNSPSLGGGGEKKEEK